MLDALNASERQRSPTQLDEVTIEQHWNVKQLEEKVDEFLNPPTKEDKK